MLFLGLRLIKTVVGRESAIEREVSRLEKQAVEGKVKDKAKDKGKLPSSQANHDDTDSPPAD
jgi:hypothetical protein